MNEDKINDSIHKIELSLVELRTSHLLLKDDVVTSLRTSMANLHSHMKDQMSNLRNGFDSLHKEYQTNHLTYMTKEDLAQFITVETCSNFRNKCAISLLHKEHEYLKKGEAAKYISYTVLAVSLVWGLVITFWPVLSILIK